jgi:hypothetical protein
MFVLFNKRIWVHRGLELKVCVLYRRWVLLRYGLQVILSCVLFVFGLLAALSQLELHLLLHL